MSKPKIAVTVIALSLIGGLLALFISGPSCRLSLKLVSVEPGMLMDDSGGDLSIITLRIQNDDSLRAWVGGNAEFEAKSCGKWTTVTNAFSPGLMWSGKSLHAILVVPAATEECRVRLQYQSPHWKARVRHMLGSRGRKVASKIPFLWQWLDSGGRGGAPDPTKWRNATLRVSIPQKADDDQGSDQQDAGKIQALRGDASSTVALAVRTNYFRVLKWRAGLSREAVMRILLSEWAHGPSDGICRS